jgi:hypothetical protein
MATPFSRLSIPEITAVMVKTIAALEDCINPAKTAPTAKKITPIHE